MTTDHKSTPNSPGPPAVTTPLPRRRFQFSLATLLWLTTVVACLAGLWPMYRNLRKAKDQLLAAQAEIGECHDEMEYPDVSDPTKIYARRVREWGEYAWTWRVYLPQKQTLRLCASSNDIPVDGFPHWTDSIRLEPGYHLLGISVSHGTIRLHTENTIRYTDQKAPVEFFSPLYYEDAVYEGVQGVANAGSPLLLLKERKRKTEFITGPKGSENYTDPKPNDGLIIWIEPASRFSRSSNDRYEE